MNVSTQLQHADDWDRHWSEFGSTTETGPSNVYRKRLIVELLREAGCTSGSRVLDIGSGRGEVIQAIREAIPGVGAMGLELSATGVRDASRRVPDALFLQRNLLEDVEPSAIPAQKATHAVCSEVLEHIDDPVLLLRNASAYMAPGCQLVVTVPCGPMCAFDRHIGHRRHFTKSDISAVLEAAGFDVVHAYGAGFPFFNLYRLLIVARGESLIEDARKPPSASMKLATAIFNLLFRLSLRDPGGWQTLAVARKR